MADNFFMMDHRLKYIDRLLASYSAGDFDKRLPLSEGLDDTDAVISGLHMLAEEVKAVTISRDHFNTIFNSVSEMVFVVTGKGLMEELNRAAWERLGFPYGGLVGRPVDVLTGSVRPSLFRQVRRMQGPEGLVRVWDRSFLTARGETFPVEITASRLAGRKGQGAMLLTAKDIGPRLAAENRLLRAVIDAQEQERLRLARDVHDGMGQQLSAVKFLVSVAVAECVAPDLRDKLQAAKEALADVIALTGNICYNLVPRTLEDFGLRETVRELAGRLERSGRIRMVVEEARGFPALSRALEIDLFRVIQEFVNNSIRHGEATYMLVRFQGDADGVEVRLKENGKGFDPALVQGAGMGLRNMYSRIRSHQGEFRLVSGPGKGTEAMIRVDFHQSA